jgi:hypothetical protein
MIVTKKFQNYLMPFTVLYIAAMLFIQYQQHYFAEENVKLKKIGEQAQRLSSIVETGLYINNFPRFSFTKNAFIMDSIVWFKFALGTESLHTIDRFSFQNGKILSKSEPMVQVDEKNILIRYHVVVKFSTPLNHQYFPVSDHKLNIVLQNTTVSPQELYFVSDKTHLGMSDDLLSGNWKPSETYVDYGHLDQSEKKDVAAFQAEFPCAAFTIDFRNEDFRHFIILYLPLFMLFLIIFISLLVAIENIGTRFSVVAGVVPILALHSLVIESVSPAGSRMTKIDHIYLTIIALSLFILMFQAYLGLAIRSLKDKKSSIVEAKTSQLRIINDLVIAIVLSLLILSITYSTFS